MVHKNFQEAIEQLSTNEDVNSEEIKNQFGLNEEDMRAMNSDTLIQGATQPAPVWCLFLLLK